MLVCTEVMLKEAALADRLNMATFRLLGRVGRGMYRGLGSGFRGLRRVGQVAGSAGRLGARGVERISDALLDKPGRAVSVGIPLLLGAASLPANVERGMNNVIPENPYMP